MGITVYQYPGCDTCRKALKWMKNRDMEFQPIHIVDSPPSRAEVEDLWRRSGLPLKKLFNTAGRSYRDGGFSKRLPEMSESEALDALAADGKLIKRPLLDAGSTVLVGFSEERYDETLA
ncbi:MAG: arsenate reductase family protein [Myxococcota bacterium]|nr:arsenate reductase family protein [Myxococcota bacterium]MEE2780158.1 arsenate reductase family protein [Myxococcota bacterium]